MTGTSTLWNTNNDFGVKNLRAELIAGSDNFGNAPLELPSLGAHESVEREFTFRPPENPSIPMVLRVLFEDSIGRHTLELPVTAVAAQVGGNIILLIIAVVVIIVGFTIFSKKGGETEVRAKAAVHVDKKAPSEHSDNDGHH